MSFSFVKARINQQIEKDLYRKRTVVSEQSSRYVVVDGKQYLNFSSNDYLGLNHHVQINQALVEGAEKFGACSSASSLITGYGYAHEKLEERICDWLNIEKCLLFNSGFSANFGFMQALQGTDTNLFLDKLSHASLIDGVLASELPYKRFRHNDYQQLDSLLDKNSSVDRIIATEGVFSMDGDKADIEQLKSLSKNHSAQLFVDDAHALGVVGDLGEGSNASGHIDITMATFGKALSTSGAFIGCDRDLHEYLINVCRHYIYSTSMSPAIAWATIKAIELCQTENWRREKINYLSRLFSTKLNKKYKLVSTQSAIHAIIIGDERSTLDTAKFLQNRGFWVTAIRPPTVPNNSSRLRVTITAGHNEQDINDLANTLNEVYF